MIWTLIGTLMVGVLAASLTFIGFRLARRGPPRWVLPAVAGLAMLVFHIASDYAWFGRTTAAFPEHLKVAETYTERSILKPWTLVAAPVERFSAVDSQAIRRNPDVPDLVMAQVHLLERYYPTVTLTQLYDCSEPRRATVGPDLEVDAAGRPTNADWVAIDENDTVRQVVCDRPTSALDQRSTRSGQSRDTIREAEAWPKKKPFSSSTTSRASASI